MPSGCSEAGRGRVAFLGAALLAGAAALPLLPPAPVEASAASRWSLGAFPVASFSGYTSHFGMRVRAGGWSEPHYGLDIAAPLGSAIHSWWGGTVSDVINSSRKAEKPTIAKRPFQTSELLFQPQAHLSCG
jgi:murein DD-endopeptidase MepM/ murein hydrolase activator NlpD